MRPALAQSADKSQVPRPQNTKCSSKSYAVISDVLPGSRTMRYRLLVEQSKAQHAEVTIKMDTCNGYMI